MRFEAPWALLLLLLLPVAFYGARRFGIGPAVHFSTVAPVLAAGRSWRQRLLFAPQVLRLLALALLAIALARPQQGTEQVRDLSKGVAIQMVVDRSGSMGQPMRFGGERLNRLEVVKRVFEEFVFGNDHGLEGRPNDLIGMVTFARYADTLCPLTLGHDALQEFLGDVNLVQRREEDGTAIGDAIALAAARLETAEETLARQTGGVAGDYQIASKAIILLTDGVNNAGQRRPMEAAALAAEWDIKIYAIGVGGAPQRRGFFSRGMELDERSLQAIAKETSGKYWRAGDAESLRAIYEEIDALEKSEVETVRYLDYREWFVPFALGALVLLVIESLLSATVFRKTP